MICKVGESQKLSVNSGIYDGLLVHALINASAVNVPLVPSDFDPSQVSVKVTLRRGKNTYMMMHDNLQVLGTFKTFQKGYDMFLNGIVKKSAQVAVSETRIRIAKLYFGGNIEVKAGDQLLVELTVANSGTFSANVASALSYLNFDLNSSKGHELGIYRTHVEPILAGQTAQSFSLGNNITRVAILNFDQVDFTNEVINNLTVSSHDYDASMILDQIIAKHNSQFENTLPDRWKDISTGVEVKRQLPYLPQSFILLDGKRKGTDYDNVKIDIAFNKANVNVSQNYLVWESYELRKEDLIDAQNKAKSYQSSKLGRAVS